MNNLSSEVEIEPRPENFWETTRYTKEFSYAVSLPTNECLARLQDLAQSQTGFFNPSSRSVKITQEANHARFEIFTQRYGRGFGYSSSFGYRSAIANGIVIPARERPEMMVVKGRVRLGGMIWLYLLALGALTLAGASTGHLEPLLFALALCLIFVRRDYNDYRQLYALIQDSFSPEYHGT